jgi:hypothetical protein
LPQRLERSANGFSHVDVPASAVLALWNGEVLARQVHTRPIDPHELFFWPHSCVQGDNELLHVFRKVIHAFENARTSETLLRNNLSKLPKINNTIADAKSASVSILSLKTIAKQKSMPREKTPWEIDAKRKELLMQGEAIKKKYGGVECGLTQEL